MGVCIDNYNVTSKRKEEYFDFEGDIEKGELSLKLEEGLGLECEGKRMDGLGNGNGNVSIKPEERAVSLAGSSSDDDYSESVRLIVVDKKVVKEMSDGGGMERKVVNEKPKAMSAKKPPKPPRAPRGLSLDSTDQKLIRELQELARLKRARVERMKALKKGKEAKTTSSRNQLLATLLTVLFCLVLFLQGISSRTSTASRIQGTPFSSEVAKLYNGPGSELPR